MLLYAHFGDLKLGVFSGRDLALEFTTSIGLHELEFTGFQSPVQDSSLWPSQHLVIHCGWLEWSDRLWDV